MSTLSTHVLDAARGAPAVGLVVRLSEAGRPVEDGLTDLDGRFRFASALAPGPYQLRFETGEWLRSNGIEDFFHPVVDVAFQVTGDRHLHVPLLLSPFAYSTYRGS